MIKVSGPALASVDRSSSRYKYLQEVHRRIAAKDSTTWGEAASAEAAIRLNWVDLPESSQLLADQLSEVSARFGKYSQVILCGMGGSSLAPEVIARSNNLNIFIVDSTDPNYINHAAKAGLAQSVIVVSSKSGSTIETSSQRAYFESELVKAGLAPQNHMVFVTDPGSSLDQEARSKGFAVINADPLVGGRFSALSAFGLVPTAIAGFNPLPLLTQASSAKRNFLKNETDIIDVAYLFSYVAGQYISFTDQGSDLPGLSDWIEQLIAESTGKDGTGRLPIVTETLADDETLNVSFTQSAADLAVVGDLGEHFIFWEWVTAIVGAALAIDPFNQPNVTEAKEQTLTLLQEWNSNGVVTVRSPYADAVDGSVEIFGKGASLTEAFSEIISNVAPDGYIAIMAYLDRRDDRALEELRFHLAELSGRPTTFGWGPRFMHSTGQFHKAGQPNGTFIQITTSDFVSGFEIPGREFDFATLVSAQGQGDGRALAKRNYPLTRFHLRNRATGISELLTAIRGAH